MDTHSDHDAFDRALVAAAFELAAGRGWARVTVADAARHASLPLDRARSRFSGRTAIALRFGRIADEAALAGEAEPGDATPRDRLFDMVMRRIDVLQTHRDGVQALLRHLPADPGLALLLTMETARSMAWLLDAAALRSTGLVGALRTNGLFAVWLWTVRAWQRDDSGELSATMAALDAALTRAAQAESMLPGARDAAVDTDAADRKNAADDPLPSADTAVTTAMPVAPTVALPPAPVFAVDDVSMMEVGPSGAGPVGQPHPIDPAQATPLPPPLDTLTSPVTSPPTSTLG